jgi:heme/copper-type cytochrome/quinol oxidase subunit 2
MSTFPQDPQIGQSLWLQRRSTRHAAHGTQWRGDWSPIALLVLLVSVVILFFVFLPSNDAVEKAKQTARDEGGGGQELPVVGVSSQP